MKYLEEEVISAILQETTFHRKFGPGQKSSSYHERFYWANDLRSTC